MRGLAGPLVKLIAFTVVTLLATYVLVATITNSSAGQTVTYRAQFSDATGLLRGDDVRVAGVRVGSIQDIKVVNRDQAEVAFSVTDERPLPTSTVARIRYRNLVGQRYLDIGEGPGTPGRQLPANGLIPLAQTVNALNLTVLFAGFQPLFQGLAADQINALSSEIISVFQGEGSTVEALFEQTASLTAAIADKDAVIGNLIDHLNAVLTTVASRDTELGTLISELQRWVSGLAQDRQAIGDSLTGINTLTATTTNLLQTIRPPLAKDITDIQALATNIDRKSDVYNGVLQRLPVKVAALTRTATYGSWFNFYLCEFNANLSLPVGGTLTPSETTAASRCEQ